MPDALFCRTCGGNTSVSDSRPTQGVDGIRRRRRCADCGERFTTVELRADETWRAVITEQWDGLRRDLDERITQAQHSVWTAMGDL